MASKRFAKCSVCDEAKSKLTMIEGDLYCSQCMEEMMEEDINSDQQPENGEMNVKDENVFDEGQLADSLGEPFEHDNSFVVIKQEPEEFDEMDQTRQVSEIDRFEDIDPSNENNSEDILATIDIKEEITIEEARVNIDDKTVEHDSKNEKSSCSYCDFQCKSYREYRTHLRQTHSEERKVICSICFFQCTGENLYRKHLQEEHEGFECMCKICHELYHLGDYNKHKQNCKGRLLFQCKSCKGYYGKKESVWKHLDEHDVPEDSKEKSFIKCLIKEQFFSCKICVDDKAYRQGLYWKHIKSAHQGHHLLCRHCPKTFKNTASRFRHTCLRDLDTRAEAGPNRERSDSTLDCKAESSRKQPVAKEYKCPECPKIFTRGFRLNEHMRKSHHPESVECDICGIEFRSKSVLKYHKAKVHTEARYDCPDCHRKFHFFSNFSRHLKTHQKEKKEEHRREISAIPQPINHSEFEPHEEEIGMVGKMDQSGNEKAKLNLRCTYCGLHFGTNPEFRAHLRQSHAEVRKVSCSICFFSCKGETRYREHLQEEHDGFECMCKFCSELYHLGGYERHKKECAGRLLFQCNSCQECYGNKEALWKHLDEHGIAEETKDSAFIECRIKDQFYSCKVCEDDRLFIHALYWKHIKNVHQGYHIRCKKCSKIFKTRGARHRHPCQGEKDDPSGVRKGPTIKRKVATPRNPPVVREFKCPDCPKVYNKSFRLNEHIKDIHRISPVTCDFCGIECKTRKLYRYHRAKVHTEPKYQCSVCPKKFHFPSSYRTHVASHQNGKKTGANHRKDTQLTGDSGESVDHENSSVQSAEELTSHADQFGSEMRDEMDNLSTENSNQYDDENTNQEELNGTTTGEEAQDLQEWENKTMKMRCTYCGLRFATNPEYRAHEKHYRKHLQEKHDGFECMCKICLELYHLGDYNKHKKQCLGRLLFQCRLCKVYYGKKESLWKHLDEHDIPEDSKDSSFTECRINEQFYNCIICEDDKAYRKDQYWKHVKSAHDGHHLRCRYCPKTFKALGGRSRHTSTECTANPASKASKQVLEEFKCPECPKVYQRSYRLNEHIQKSHQDKAVKCETCAEEFKAEGLLKYHMITVHTEPKYNCHLCPEKFFFPIPYHKHLATHQNVKPAVVRSNLFVDNRRLSGRLAPKEFKCPECPKVYTKGASLNDHIRIIHQQAPETCDICGIELKTRKLYRYHKATVHTEPRFECAQCSKKFHFPVTYRKHMAVHQRQEAIRARYRRVELLIDAELTGAGRKQLDNHPWNVKEELEDLSLENSNQCDTDDADTIQSDLLEELDVKEEITIEEARVDIDNEKTVHKKRVKRTVCLYCGIDCETNFKYLNHIKESHPEERKVFCSICFFACRGETMYRAHLQEKHDGFECVCKICLDYYHKRRYEHHKKQCLGRLLFQCNSCMEYFGKKESLWKHLDEHDIPKESKESQTTECRIKERFYSCVICADDKAYDEDLYWEHVKDEHDGHYLRCKYCPKTFKTKNAQSGHTYKECTAGPPRERKVKQEFKCSVCPKMFRFRDNLRSHLRKHYNAIQDHKPRACDVCGLECKTRSHLKYHKQKFHSNPKYQCPFCSKKFHFPGCYQRHVRTHKVEQFITCEICGRLFRDRDSYNLHWQKRHQQEQENQENKKRSSKNYQGSFASYLKTQVSENTE